LKEQEAGIKTADLGRKGGISEASFIWVMIGPASCDRLLLAVLSTGSAALQVLRPFAPFA
jgi:hypothetical protein